MGYMVTRGEIRLMYVGGNCLVHVSEVKLMGR